MIVRAELHCYHCGYAAARIEGELNGAVEKARVVASGVGPGVRLAADRKPRCGRCGGRLFIEEYEEVRYPPTVIVPLPPGRRRGRPPRALTEQKAS